MKTKSEILEECYYKKTPEQDPYWHTPEELRETHGYSACIDAMESYASEQLSELRKKIEELRDFFKIYKYSEVTKMTILVELNQILKED